MIVIRHSRGVWTHVVAVALLFIVFVPQNFYISQEFVRVPIESTRFMRFTLILLQLITAVNTLRQKSLLSRFAVLREVLRR